MCDGPAAVALEHARGLCERYRADLVGGVVPCSYLQGSETAPGRVLQHSGKGVGVALGSAGMQWFSWKRLGRMHRDDLDASAPAAQLALDDIGEVADAA